MVTIAHVFKSYFYENTYVPPVDLSDEALSQDLLENQDPQTASKIQSLISQTQVQAILSAPLDYELDVFQKRGKVLQDHGFNLLGSEKAIVNQEKVPFYSVIEHDEVPGFVIKAGGVRLKDDAYLVPLQNKYLETVFPTKEDGILRIAMAKRIREVAQNNGIELVVPEKKFVRYAEVKADAKVTEKYCVISQKIDVLSKLETVAKIKEMGSDEQKALAKNISRLVKEAGLVDASFDNIRFTKSGKLAIIDTEPFGLMTVKKTDFWSRLFPTSYASLEKCARIGMHILQHVSSKSHYNHEVPEAERNDAEPGLEAFKGQVEQEYEQVKHPKWSKWKIDLCKMTLGLYPAAVAVASFFHYIILGGITAHISANQTLRAQEIKQAVDFYGNNIFTAFSVERINKEYDKKVFPLTRQFFSWAEGIPAF